MTFDEWYAQNAFDYEKNPLGSRECGLQRKAWNAALAGLALRPVHAVDVTDELVEIACRAYYNSGIPVRPPVFEGMRAALTAALAHPRPMAVGTCGTCGETIRFDELTGTTCACAPTVEQAGEVVSDRHMGVLRQYLIHLNSQNPTQGTRPRMSDVRAALKALLAQPRPVGVPDDLTDPDNPWRRAVEHAGYLVTTINRYMEAKGEAHVAFEQVEGVEDPTDEAIAELESAQETEHELWDAMRNDVYEFTKRRDRAMATLTAAPAPAKAGGA